MAKLPHFGHEKSIPPKSKIITLAYFLIHFNESKNVQEQPL